ncbi:ribosome recycling factor [Candidatus Ishikawella capsulata]|uniref:Ribosome-recycling factor n=1 Tax=Candidatus Ishikawaella capsulata Mpkobe TaxID=476281 RepID=C5WCK6_9ENTR|nr:ribosome recycling factor [Candidatus Ishikawaella capsulata]BAH83062.1 ribosome releasing factor [Candidatus Ishikawaella capsulata Mpkobe]
MINNIKKQSDFRMQKCILAFEKTISKIRTGRASPLLIKDILIEYYGILTPLNKLANISLEDLHTLKISLFDNSIKTAVERVIRNSDLDLNPNVIGNDIRIPIPPLTEDRRKKLMKIVRTEAENSRISVRNIRRDENDKIRNLLKNKIITEDEERQCQEEIQKMTSKYIKKVDDILHEKEKELMRI